MRDAPRSPRGTGPLRSYRQSTGITKRRAPPTTGGSGTHHHFTTHRSSCATANPAQWPRRRWVSCVSSCGRREPRTPAGSAAPPWAWRRASSAPRPSRRRPTAPPARPTRGHHRTGRARCSCSTTARRATPACRTPASPTRPWRPAARWNPRRPRSWSSTTPRGRRRRRRSTAAHARRTSPSSPKCWKGCATATCTTPTRSRSGRRCLLLSGCSFFSRT